MQKYKNTPTRVGNLRFASKAEARRYQDLLLLWKAGEVAWFTRQPRFDLPGDITYVADFLVVWNLPRYEVSVEDVKGFETAAFKLKRKLFEQIYMPLTIIGKKR